MRTGRTGPSPSLYRCVFQPDAVVNLQVAQKDTWNAKPCNPRLREMDSVLAVAHVEAPSGDLHHLLVVPRCTRRPARAEPQTALWQRPKLLLLRPRAHVHLDSTSHSRNPRCSVMPGHQRVESIGPVLDLRVWGARLAVLTMLIAFH